MTTFTDTSNFIWQVADLIRGPYRPNQYKDVMLPLTVLRRLDCVLEPTKSTVLAEHAALREKGQGVVDNKLQRITGVPFYNVSPFTFEKLKADPGGLAANLVNFMKGSRPRRARSSTRSSLRSTSPTWRNTIGCSWWCRSSRKSICIRRRCRTSRWATSSRT